MEKEKTQWLGVFDMQAKCKSCYPAMAFSFATSQHNYYRQILCVVQAGYNPVLHPYPRAVLPPGGHNHILQLPIPLGSATPWWTQPVTALPPLGVHCPQVDTTHYCTSPGRTRYCVSQLSWVVLPLVDTTQFYAASPGVVLPLEGHNPLVHPPNPRSCCRLLDTTWY